MAKEKRFGQRSAESQREEAQKGTFSAKSGLSESGRITSFRREIK
jgi:hypothetical protein